MRTTRSELQSLSNKGLAEELRGRIDKRQRDGEEMSVEEKLICESIARLLEFTEVPVPVMKASRVNPLPAPLPRGNPGDDILW